MTLPTKAGQLQEQIDTLRATVEQQQRQIDTAHKTTRASSSARLTHCWHGSKQ